ncbi:HAMP domain-containing sensor histidine kinase [Desulfocurvibacter africanus]|uniref:HAMP domain-containing sensor histidine kinase n=1 Tax=Desulfocurvibacter africanus TaxID=873 RepID=UPI00042146D6|nr:ATP-binding protein [Desulfocurvibacter africanus]
MPQSFSFRSRLILSFIVVIALSLLVSTWYSRHVIGKDLLDEAKQDTLRQVRMLTLLLERDLTFETPAELHAWLVEVSERQGSRLTFVAENGRVLADSSVPFDRVPLLDNHGQRPEIIAARDREAGVAIRHSDTLDKNLVYAAQMVKPRGGLPEGFLRVSTEHAHLDARLERTLGGLLIGAGATFALAALISFLLARQLSTQVGTMSNMAEAIGKGNYSQRLRLYPGKEFSPLAKSINRMAESIQIQIETITVQKQQLVAILDNMKEGVMLLSADGRIQAVNRAMTLIFPGIEHCQGKTPLEAIMDPVLHQECERALENRETGAPVSLLLEPRSGVFYDVGIVPLKESGSGLGAVVVFHDISRLKHLERVRRDFVANVSHELRTPLTSIKGYAETLQSDPAASPQAKGFLNIIVKNANHMTKILGDLLNLSRLEADRQAFELAPVDAQAAVMSAYRECESLGRGRGVALVCRIPEKAVFVLADYDRLVQVFRNLIENALRYSPEHGSVTVFHQTGDGEVLFGVSDRGPGIPRDEQAKIFERFYRVEKHRLKMGGSSGLGLAIAKHIVERHGGRIWVVSPATGEDTGATFYFTMPPASQDAAKAQD